MATTTDPLAAVDPLAATAPINQRNTYPPGQPAMSAPPKRLGTKPTGISQIMYPDGIAATHIQGPLVSGPTPGVQGASGSAQLTLTLQIDSSMGNFSIPIQFPGGSFIQSITAVTYETGLDAGASVQLGQQVNTADIMAATVLPAKGAVLTPVLPLIHMPLWDGVCPMCPFQAWLTVTGNVSHPTGGSIVIITYTRLAGPWSVPATNYSR